MPNEGFELIGHDTPLGRPGPAVPVGRSGDRLVVVYAGNDGPVVVEVDDDAEFVRLDAGAMAALRGFDYTRQRLFATDEKHVEVYAVESEREFFRRLLNDSKFSAKNPFLRLTLAEAAGEPDAVRREVTSCVSYLEETASELVEPWYAEQRQSLKKRFGPVAEAILPAKWEELRGGRQWFSPAKGGGFFVPKPSEQDLMLGGWLGDTGSQDIWIMPAGIVEGPFNYRVRVGGIDHTGYLTYELPRKTDERSILLVTGSPTFIRDEHRVEYDRLVEHVRETEGRFSGVKNIVNRLAEHEFANLPNVQIAVHRFGPVPVYLLPETYEIENLGNVLGVRIGVYPSLRLPAGEPKGPRLPFLKTKTEFVRSLSLGLGTMFTRYLEDVGEAMFDIVNYSGLARVPPRAREIEVALAESIKTKLEVAVPSPQSYQHPRTEHERAVRELFEREYNWLFTASYARQFALYFLNELYRLISLASRSSEYLEGFEWIQEQFDALLGFGYTKSARERLPAIAALDKAMEAYTDRDYHGLREINVEREDKWVHRLVQFARFVAALNHENLTPTAGRLLISSSHRDVPVTRILMAQITDYVKRHYAGRVEVLHLLNGAGGAGRTESTRVRIWFSDIVGEIVPKDVEEISDDEDKPYLWMAREAAYGLLLGKRLFFLLEHGVDTDRIRDAMKRGLEPGGLVTSPARVPQWLERRLIEYFDQYTHVRFSGEKVRSGDQIDPAVREAIHIEAGYAVGIRHRDILVGLYSMFPEYARATLQDIQEAVPYPKSATKARLAYWLHERHPARYRTERAAARAITGAWKLSSARPLLIDGKPMTLMTLHERKRYSGNLREILKRLRPDFTKDDLRRWERMILNMVGSQVRFPLL